MTMKRLQINLQMSRERPAPQLLVSAAQVKKMTRCKVPINDYSNGTKINFTHAKMYSMFKGQLWERSI